MTIIWCMVPQIWSKTEFFVISEHFLHLYPSNNPKNQNFEKMKKPPGDIIRLHICTIHDNGNIIILHKCTTNHDHTLYCSLDMTCNGCNCYFSFWANFCPFFSLAAWKIKIKKKLKKHLETSFYNSVQKIMIICYTFLKYGAWQM